MVRYRVNIPKISPPQPPRKFYRHRLVERLSGNRQKKLILVLGQAGQGKSTLAAKYAQSIRKETIWINIDTSDSDPINFMLLLISAYQNRWPELDFRTITNNLSTHESAAKIEILYSIWAQSFWQIVPDRTVIVLDALEQISFESPTFLLIEALIHHSPSKIQFVLVSRKRPPLRVERLKVDKSADTIANEDLAFTLNETGTFFRNTYHLNFPGDLIEEIQRFTAGWISGVIIFGQWLAKKGVIPTSLFLDKKMEMIVPREFYEYFSEEVFLALDELKQDFLVKTAFLEVLEPKLANALLQIGNSSVLLDAMARDNLFIQSFVTRQKEVFYRYHQVFRQFLLLKYHSGVESNPHKQLCLRAAKYFEQNDRLEDSLPYYSQARRFDTMEKVLARIGMQMVRRGQLNKLEDYLKEVPASARQRYPWLLFFHSLTIRSKEGPKTLDQLCLCRALFNRKGDKNGQALTLSFLIETALLLGDSPIEMDELLDEAEKLLYRTAQQIQKIVQARLWLQMGFATLRGVGNFRKALSICQTAFYLAKEDGDINIQFHALALSKLACAYLGEFDRADKLDSRIRDLRPHCSTEMKIFHLSTDCPLNIYKGHKKAAVNKLNQLEEAIEKYGFYHFFTWLIIYKILILPKIGRAKEAEEIVKAWLRMCKEPTFKRGVGLLGLGFCRYHGSSVRKGVKALEDASVREGIKALEEAADILSTGPLKSEFHYQAARKGLAISSYLSGDYERADSLLWGVLEYSESIRSDTLIAEAHLLIGLNKYAAGDHIAAVKHLRAGFHIMRTRRYLHLVIIQDVDLARACLIGLKLMIFEDLGWVQFLFIRYADQSLIYELKRLAKKTKDRKLQQLFQNIDKAFFRSKLPRLTFHTLGEFTVKKEGEPIRGNQWKGHGNVSFLKTILAYGGQMVPKDVIMEALWPERNQQAAENNFKSSLHRLRKVLEPEADRRAGYNYIHLRNAMVGLDPELCRVDAMVFEQNAKKALSAKIPEEALAWGEKAVVLYKGDFLPFDLYEPWIESSRVRLKNQYISLLAHLSNIYIKQEKWAEACQHLESWLGAAPCSDQACRRLMQVYAHQGNSNKALQVYKAFESHLANDIDVSPDKKTMALYMKISKPL